MSQADIGSNGIHVTPLQNSVTFLVILVVFNYIFDKAIRDGFKYCFGTKLVIVIDYILQLSVLTLFKLFKFYDYFNLYKFHGSLKFK